MTTHRFKPQPPSDGNSGPNLKALLRGGKFLKLRKRASRAPAIGRAQQDVMQARVQVLNKTPAQRASFAAELRWALSAFSTKESETNRKRKNGVVPPGEIKKADAVAKSVALTAALAILKKLRANITDAAKREMRAQAARLRKLGVALPSQRDLDSLAEETTSSTLAAPFPGTKTTVADRIAALARKIQKTLMLPVIATAQHYQAARAQAERALTSTKPGRVRVPGGSPLKNAERLNRTEQARVMREVTLTIAKETNVSFLYWRLSPLHEWYGGDEICERLAVETGPDVRAELARRGIPVNRVSLAGLYTLNQYPEVPHPHCMCTPEMLVLP